MNAGMGNLWCRGLIITRLKSYSLNILLVSNCLQENVIDLMGIHSKLVTHVNVLHYDSNLCSEQ